MNISAYIIKPFNLKSLKEAFLKVIEEQYRVKDELALKERFSLINNNVIMLNTDVNGVIIEVTDAFVKLSGYSRKELIGEKVSIVGSGHNDITVV